MGVTNFDLVQANGFLGGGSNGLPGKGKVFFVLPYTGVESRDGSSPTAAVKTLRTALSKMTASRNDIVHLIAESETAANTTDYLTAALDWNKDMCHIRGVHAGGMLGARARVANKSTSVVPTPMFTLSADSCLIENVNFYHGQGSANPSAASTCVLVSGNHNVIRNCQISGIGHTELDDANSNSLTVSGSENLFENCYIGLDTVIRATSVTEVILSGSPTRNIFRNCIFVTYTSGSTFKMITIPTTMDRFTIFDNCIFLAAQNITSAVAPTGLIGITTANGVVIVKDCLLYGFAQYVTADNNYVKMLGHDGTNTGSLIGIATSVNAA